MNWNDDEKVKLIYGFGKSSGDEADHDVLIKYSLGRITRGIFSTLATLKRDS